MIEVNTNVETKQYVVVRFDNELYGIDIQYVYNIVRMQRVTRVPKSPDFIKGVINLRGEIIPVMSLRLKFELSEDEYTNNTRIIIVKLDQQTPIGLLVDEVKEVIELADTNIEKISSDNKDEKSSYLSGVGKVNNELVTLLNINGIINEKENN